MKIKKNGKVVNLTESDLKRIVKRVLTEQTQLRDIEIPTIGTFKPVVSNIGKSWQMSLNDEDPTGVKQLHAKYDCKTGKSSIHLTTNTQYGKDVKLFSDRKKAYDFIQKWNGNDTSAKVKEIKTEIKSILEQHCVKA
jgi:hypothetical protein